MVCKSLNACCYSICYNVVTCSRRSINSVHVEMKSRLISLTLEEVTPRLH